MSIRVALLISLLILSVSVRKAGVLFFRFGPKGQNIPELIIYHF